MTKNAVKKRNPQDATLRNIRALKKRVDQLEKDVALTSGQLAGLIMVFKDLKRGK